MIILFIVFFIIGILLTICAIENNSIVFSLIGVILWLVLMAGSFYLQPLYYDGDGVIGFFQKWSMFASCLVFIFINLKSYSILKKVK